MNPLETRYRRILRLLPRAYRERRAEELLGVLLDGAAEGQSWPRAGQAASLAALAVRLHFGAPGAARRATARGEILRRVALGGLLLQTLVYLTFIALDVLGMVDLLRHGGSLRWIGHQWFLYTAIDGFTALLPAGALFAALAGRRWTARVLALIPAALVTYDFVAAPAYTVTSDYLAVLGLAYLSCAATILGFHRDAPPMIHARRWRRATVGASGLLIACMVGGEATLGSIYPAHAATTELLYRVENLMFSPLGPALAAAFGLVRARRSSTWPAALLLLGLPSLLIVPRNVVLTVQGKASHTFADLFASHAWPFLGFECLIAELVLAAALVWALRRESRPAYVS